MKKIKIDKNIKDQLIKYNNYLMMDGARIISFKEPKIEEVEEKYGFRNKKTRTAYYVTSCKMLGYDFEGGYLGNSYYDDMEYYLLHRDLDGLRRNFLVFQNQLKAFGFEMKKIEEPTT